MAAELSTGLLAWGNVHKKKPAVSMLVTRVEGNFFKKAIGKTYFTCEDGTQFQNAIDHAIRTHESVTVTAYSAGRNAANDLVAEFRVTWSFRLKT